MKDYDHNIIWLDYFNKTLSYIVYTQPVSSKQLVEVRGSGVYAHLKELRQLDFVEYQNVGRTKIYSTTEKFQKYFVIQGDIDIVKQKLFKRKRKEPEITVWLYLDQVFVA